MNLSLLLPGLYYNRSHGFVVGDYVPGGDVFIWGEKRGANHRLFQERLTCHLAREPRLLALANPACPRRPDPRSGALGSRVGASNG